MIDDAVDTSVDKDEPKIASQWLIALKLAEKDQKKWIERGKKIVRRFRDDRQGAFREKRYNILWSNVRTMFPAIYSKKPKAQVERRYKDAAPEARCASEILERVLQYEIDHYCDFDAAIRGALLDRLLPGRGVAWVRFEAQVPNDQQVQTTDDAQQDVVPNKYECTPADYVFWEDFRCSPARTWEEVTWVARRVYMGRDEGVERFGDIFKEVPLASVPIGLEELQQEMANSSSTEKMKKAKVWEIWDKNTLTANWVAEDFSKQLDEKADPIEVDGFFPCPKPLYATLTTDTLIPVADYIEYQDQANELDNLTQRISMLVKAVKVVGVYDASQTGIQRLLNEGVDNVMIPVDNWAQFGEKGIKGTTDFLPIDMVIDALNELYKARDICKQVIYDITGLSDIIRGSSVASETATAQQIKSNYASLRLKETISDVARFASDILRLKADMICSFYSSQALKDISGIMGTDDAPLADQAIALLKSEPLRNYQIEVATDSMVELDEQQEKQSRMEFLQAAGGFLKQAVEAAQQVPELAPLMGEMLMFGVRGFKAGRPIEAAFESTVKALSQPKPQKPDPEQMKLQAEQQQAQQKMQMDVQLAQMKAQSDMQVEQMRAQVDLEIEQRRLQMEAQMEQFRIGIESQAANQVAMQEQAFERWKAELEAATKVITAQISATKSRDETVAGNAEGEFNQEVRP